MQIGRYFTLAELTHSEMASRRGLNNTPPETAIENLRLLCAFVLDPLRELVGSPIIVISGYRSQLVNTAVGGAAKSQHLKGEP
jgi:uncharacterized protein YcbK (DUF882 family)